MTQEELKSIELFYTPPKDEYFEELRSICIRFWNALHHSSVKYHHETAKHDLSMKYTEEKIARIQNLKNEGANFIYMVQMIHQNARQVLAKGLSLETRNEISMRLYGFDDNEFDPFNIWNTKNNLNTV